MAVDLAQGSQVAERALTYRELAGRVPVALKESDALMLQVLVWPKEVVQDNADVMHRLLDTWHGQPTQTCVALLRTSHVSVDWSYYSIHTEKNRSKFVRKGYYSIIIVGKAIGTKRRLASSRVVSRGPWTLNDKRVR